MAAVRGVLSGASGSWIPGLPHRRTAATPSCGSDAALNVLTTDLACKLEGSPRSLALSIQQLAVVGELLVNRALDNVLNPVRDRQVRTVPEPTLTCRKVS